MIMTIERAERDRRIAERYKDHSIKVEDICTEFDVTNPTVRAAVKKAGGQLRKPKSAVALIDLIKPLAETGMTCS